MRILKGKVASGLGNFSDWIEKLQPHYLRKTGMKFFPGTLNLQLEQPYNVPKNVIRLEKEDYGGTVSVNIVPCKIFDRDAFILRTENNERGIGHHPLTVVEVACDVKLRDQYNLKDGDTVEVSVME